MISFQLTENQQVLKRKMENFVIKKLYRLKKVVSRLKQSSSLAIARRILKNE